MSAFLETPEKVSEAAPPYLDPSLPLEERVRDLVSRLTLREKIAQMLHRSPPVPRLGIPEYGWWNEALHGVGRAGKATIFPQSIGLAASFNVELVKEVATAISDEARAKFNEAQRLGNRETYFGLTFWSPNINIFRDPRWGRGQETYGECPYLTSRLGVAFIQGLQGDDPRFLKVAACAKHFAVHSGPEPERHSFDAVVSVRDLRETYLPAFKAAVCEAKVEAVMGAYNRLNGEPCCGSERLLEELLRGEWGFQGHVLSDCWAIKDFHVHHGVTDSPEASAAMAVKAGCDLNCGEVYRSLLKAVQAGLVEEEAVTTSVERLFRTRMKLGLFDPPKTLPWENLSPETVNCEAHRDLALRAARESVVLLKNESDLLPLSRDITKIAVIGPSAADDEVLWGNYHGFSPRMTNLLEGIVGAVSPGTQVVYSPGGPGEDMRTKCADADVIVATLGFSPKLEGEDFGDAGVPTLEGGGDRLQIGLPQAQLELLKQLQATGKPVVLVLTGGSPIELEWASEHVPAILMVWYPGEAGGEAVADVLFGDYNPAGRLPVSFPRSLDDLPPFTEYAMEGRTYRYRTKPARYPFGFGLSYTRFRYQNIRVHPRQVEVEVANIGNRAGDEVAQVYLCREPGAAYGPRLQLAGFQRVHLRTGETRQLRFDLTDEHFLVYDEEGEALCDRHSAQIHVGGGPPGIEGDVDSRRDH